MTAAELAYAIAGGILPGLTADESQIAIAWIQAHLAEFDNWEFQVRIGSAVDIGPNFDAATRQAAAAASQKRADIIASRGSEVTIVEIKPRIPLGAMGQLMGYGALWTAAHPETTAVHLVAVGRAALEDVPELLNAHGITVELFPGAYVEPLPLG